MFVTRPATWPTSAKMVAPAATAVAPSRPADWPSNASGKRAAIGSAVRPMTTRTTHPFPDQPKMFTPAEVAERIGVTARSLRRWVDLGKVCPDLVTPGGHFRWNENGIEAIRARRGPGGRLTQLLRTARTIDSVARDEAGDRSDVRSGHPGRAGRPGPIGAAAAAAPPSARRPHPEPQPAAPAPAPGTRRIWTPPPLSFRPEAPPPLAACAAPPCTAPRHRPSPPSAARTAGCRCARSTPRPPPGTARMAPGNPFACR
jgi:hypothetical protein